MGNMRLLSEIMPFTIEQFDTQMTLHKINNVFVINFHCESSLQESKFMAELKDQIYMHSNQMRTYIVMNATKE